MGKMTMKQALKECPLFATLSDGDLDKVAAMTSERDQVAGETIFQEGAAADELYLLLEGKVALQMTLPGGQSIKRGSRFGRWA
jgi:CRP-like cAMP-binding protein